MGTTSIEWTDATWNPVTGCSKVSAGCKNCYAEKVADRFWGDRKFTDVQCHEDRLDQPLRWRRPRRVFVNSMSDLFHDAVPDDFIARVFAVMALAPQHTFQVLTKRPARMLKWFTGGARPNIGVYNAAADLLTHEGGTVDFSRMPLDMAHTRSSGGNWWPLPNVWLGVSVEDQRAADERIPLLLQTPAAVRFLSCEPLLGPVDLSGWGAAASSSEFGFEQPPGWNGYPWPEWVPVDQREQIEKFWNVRDGRGPRGWVDNGRVNRVPANGARVGVTLANGGWGTVVPALSPLAVKRGRWLHSWNNVGRVITDDAETIYASACRGPSWLSEWLQRDGKYRHQLHWVIAGGESGPGARPCDVAWIRSIVEQCKAAAVPCFVKQMGARAGLACTTKAGGHEFRDIYTRDCGFWPPEAGSEHDWILRMKDRRGGDPTEWPEGLRVREFPAVEARA